MRTFELTSSFREGRTRQRLRFVTWPALAACLLLALQVSWPAQGVGRGPSLLPAGAEVAHTMVCGKGGAGDLVLDLYRATRPPEPSPARGSRLGRFVRRSRELFENFANGD